jgi:hypothetical protein
MGEPREIGQIGDCCFRLTEIGTIDYRYVEDDEWQPEPNPDTVAAVREVARLQDENRRLREEGIRDTLHILFNECEWGVQTSRSIALFFPPGFSLPTEQTISRTAMADALTDALLPLVP